METSINLFICIKLSKSEHLKMMSEATIKIDPFDEKKFQCLCLQEMNTYDKAVCTLRERNFALVDCEGIQTSKDHCCIRSMYILSKDGFTCQENDFFTCKPFKQLEDKYKKAFIFCKKHVHRLRYNPKDTTHQCTVASQILFNFVRRNNIKIVLYKGGTIEKKLCEEMNIEAYNIERLGVLKIYNHSPNVETHFHYNCLLNIGCLFRLPENVSKSEMV